MYVRNHLYIYRQSLNALTSPRCLEHPLFIDVCSPHTENYQTNPYALLNQKTRNYKQLESLQKGIFITKWLHLHCTNSMHFHGHHTHTEASPIMQQSTQQHRKWRVSGNAEPRVIPAGHSIWDIHFHQHFSITFYNHIDLFVSFSECITPPYG